MASRQSESTTYDFTNGVQQVGHRDFRFSLPTSGSNIGLTSWAINFQQHPQSRARYRRIEQMLGDVGADGLVREHLRNVPGERFGSTSERTDLLGEYATIWITASAVADQGFGAVLAALSGAIVQVMAIPPYPAAGDERAISILEHVGLEMWSRAPELLMANEVTKENLMARLPILDDLSDFVIEPIVSGERYEDRR